MILDNDLDIIKDTTAQAKANKILKRDINCFVHYIKSQCYKTGWPSCIKFTIHPNISSSKQIEISIDERVLFEITSRLDVVLQKPRTRDKYTLNLISQELWNTTVRYIEENNLSYSDLKVVWPKTEYWFSK